MGTREENTLEGVFQTRTKIGLVCILPCPGFCPCLSYSFLHFIVPLIIHVLQKHTDPHQNEMQKLEPGSNAEPHTLLHKSVTDMTQMNLISWKRRKTLSVHFEYYWLHYLHQTHKACHWISVLLHRWWWFNLHKPKNCMLKSYWHLKENGSSMNIWYVKETIDKLPPLPLLHIQSYTTSFMLK